MPRPELCRTLDAQFSAELEPANAHVFRLLPVNIALNIASLLVLAVLVFSVVGMPRYLRYVKAMARVRRGICGICLYDLKAIERTPEGKRCPECGVLWPTSALARRRG